jgi:hypothetical protein
MATAPFQDFKMGHVAEKLRLVQPSLTRQIRIWKGIHPLH